MENSNENDRMMQKKQELEKVIKKIFEEILVKYKLMIDQIR